MKIVGLTILGAFALIGAFVAGLFVLNEIENPSSSFRTYAELEASGLIERGWVPEYLPSSATNIEETHNIDTNSGRASFTYLPGDTTPALANCQLLRETSEGAKFLCPPFAGQTSILVLGAEGKGKLSVHAELGQLVEYEACVKDSFEYVLKICNAAIHGQFIPEGYAHEALSMGFMDAD